MCINCQQNRVYRSVKTVHTNLIAKHRQLHKLKTCNSIFEKSPLSDMHYPVTDIQADFEINRANRHQITVKEIISTNDRRTDRRRVQQ